MAYIPPAELDKIHLFYRQGKYLDAHAHAQQFGDYLGWEGAEDRVMAARLCTRLGSSKLYRYLITTTYRQDRKHLRAALHYAYCAMWRGRDLIANLKWIESYEPEKIDDPEMASEWLALQARAYAQLRDYDTAYPLLERAAARHDRHHGWIYSEKSDFLEEEDRYDEAVAAAEQALAANPTFRPAIQQMAGLYIIQNQEERAREYLIEYATPLQSGEIYAQLTNLDLVLQDFDAAEQHLEQTMAHSPLADKSFKKWEASQRVDIETHRKNWDVVIEQANIVGGGYFEKLVKNLEAHRETGKRVVLDVAYQRQHHVTCAPATMTVLARYFGREVEHLEIAEEICYDGTPRDESRYWAEAHGWLVREFTLTPEACTGLIDRGMPFALSTSGPGMGHMQAVIGYDTYTGIMVIRDPYIRSDRDFLFKESLEVYASTGPACMLMIPPERAGELEGLELLDAEIYDIVHRLQRALRDHIRADVLAAWEALQSTYPEHRLTCLAGSMLAGYDHDFSREAEWLGRLVEQYPEDQNLFMRWHDCLRGLQTHKEHLALLKDRAEANLEKTGPMIWQAYADELRADAREIDNTRWWIRKCIRYESRSASHYFTYACSLWDAQRFEEALAYYRAAATLADKSEQYTQSFFLACRHFRSTEQALDFIIRRYERYRHLNTGPARTLYWAYENMDEDLKSFEVLEEAMLQQPDDHDFKCYAAEIFGRYGRYDRAQQLLDESQGKSHPEYWLAQQAALHLLQGRQEEALALYRQIREISPSKLDVIRDIARLEAQLEGERAAITFIEGCLEQFPHYQALHELYLSWLPHDEPQRHEQAVRRIIALNPQDAWARRELANDLALREAYDEAFVELEHARALEPHNPSYYNLYGFVCQSARKIPEAREALQKSIELSPDSSYAATLLLNLSPTLEEKRLSLEFIFSELKKQVIGGDGILWYEDLAANIIDPEVLESQLRNAWQARPDLWQSWVGLIQHLRDTDKTDEALQLAEQATERFPLVPRLWLELSLVQRARLNIDAERAALQKALEINPGWERPLQNLAETYERRGDFETALKWSQRALVFNRMSHQNHGYVASYQWPLGQREEALQSIEKALELESGYDWAWSRFYDWCEELGTPERYTEFAKRMTEESPGDPAYWINYSYGLSAATRFDERMAAVDKAIELAPTHTQWHQAKANLLAVAHRFDEAIAVCQDPRWGDQVPSALLYTQMVLEDDRGNREASKELLKKFLEDNPQNNVGWRRLADYHREAEEKEAYLEASDRVIETAPQESLSYGYRISALIELDRGDEIVDDCRRAIALDPAYTFAGVHLFNHYLDNKKLLDASALLARVAPHWPPDYHAQQNIRLLIKKKDKHAALAELDKFLELPQAGQDETGAIGDELFEAKKGDPAFAVFEKKVKAGTIHPAGASYWGLLLSHMKKDADARKFIAGANVENEIERAAIEGYIEHLGNNRRDNELIAAHKQFREKLMQHTALWGITLRAMQQCRQHKRIDDYMQGVEQREGVEMWMLCNHIITKNRTGEIDSLEPVFAQALQLPPDHTHDMLVLFYALFCLKTNRIEEGHAVFNTINYGLLTDYYKTTWDILQHTFTGLEDTAQRADALKGLRALIKKHRRDDGYVTYKQFALVATEALARNGALPPTLKPLGLHLSFFNLKGWWDDHPSVQVIPFAIIITLWLGWRLYSRWTSD